MGFHALVLLILFLVSGPLGILAAGESDPTQTEVEKAKAAHGEALEKAKQALLDAFDAEIKSATKKGDLALLDDLTSELASFTSEGRLPASRPMKEPLEKHQRAVDAAGAALLVAYESAVKEYTKLKEFDKAEAVRKQSKELSESRARGQETQQKDAVAGAVARSREEYKQDLALARAEALEALEKALAPAAEKGDFDRVQAIRAAKEALDAGGKFPQAGDGALKAIQSRFEKAEQAAELKWVSGYNLAIKRARTSGETALAKELVAEKDSFAAEHGLVLNRKIPKDAVFLRGHAYKLIRERGDWIEAKVRCEKLGGFLACISDGEENAFVAKLAEPLKGYKEVWIGLHDPGIVSGKNTNDWAWVSGEPLSYTNWFPGQPNNGAVEFPVALVVGGQWHDYNKGQMKFPCVCEWVNREPEFAHE